MDLTKRSQIWTSPAQPSRGLVARPHSSYSGPQQASSGPAQPYLINFQPLTTVVVPASTAPAGSAIQPFSAWFDGANVNEIHFKVEVLQAAGAPTLYLESAPTIDADFDQWKTIASWSLPISSPGFEIVTAVSSSDASGYGAEFTRYIRWRVGGGTAGSVCFRIKAIVGASFTQYKEAPRVV